MVILIPSLHKCLMLLQMKSSVALLLFGLAVFVATISARPNHSEPDLSNDESNFDHNIAESRHHSRRERRRHSRQISDRYERLSPSHYITKAEFELYKQTRESIDLDSTKADVKIIKQLLREYIDFLKKPYSSPAGPATGGYAQPIYIMLPPNPYSQIPPVKPCNSYNNANNGPDLNNRNGPDDNVINTDEDENDEGRPISFKPVNTNSPQGRPLPPVEHGSVQAGVSYNCIKIIINLFYGI